MTQKRAKRTIALLPVGGPLRIVGELPPVQYHVDYERYLAAFGAQGKVQWYVDGELPDGIQVYIPPPWQRSNGTMRVYGNSGDFGDFPITVRVVDAVRNSATRDYILKVMRFPMPALLVDESINFQLCAEDGVTPLMSE